MAQLRQEYQQFSSRDAEILAVGPEDARSFSTWWRRNKMPFPGIPDPDHDIARLFGQQVKIIKLGRMPAMIVINKSGKIVHLHYGDSMSDISPDEEILAVLDAMNETSQ